MKEITKCFTLLALIFSFSASAGVIKAIDSVIQNSMGEMNCCGDNLIDMLNQEGLSSNYVDGVTDFDTFTSSGVTHSGDDSTSWLSAGPTSGFLIFDLGSLFNVTDFVMWNGAGGISASVNNFSLTTSQFSDFSTSSFAGNFTGHQSHYGATVYDMNDSIARYVRFDIGGNFGNPCCTVIGDIAFDVTATSSVPAPTAVWLFGSGLIGLIGMRKRSVKLTGKYA